MSRFKRSAADAGICDRVPGNDLADMSIDDEGKSDEAIQIHDESDPPWSRKAAPFGPGPSIVSLSALRAGARLLGELHQLAGLDGLTV